MKRSFPKASGLLRMRQSNGLVFALWGFGAVAVILVLYRGWMSPIANRDFISVWVAGKLALAGHADQAFDRNILGATARQLSGNPLKIAYPYPPQALFIAVPISLLPLPIAFWAWQAVSAFLFYLAARPYVPNGMPRFLAVLTPAVLINVIFGQVGLFFGALWLFAFSGSWASAAALTFKPHLGILVGGEVVRRRQVLLTVAFTFLILGLSAIAFGLEAWRVWFNNTFAGPAGDLIRAPPAIWYTQMTTPYLGYGLAGWACFALTALILLIRSFNVFTAATAAFLMAPYGFHYDMTVVCLGFGILLFQKWLTMPPWQTFVCALVFLSPILVSLGTWVIPPLLLAGLYIQSRNGAIENARAMHLRPIEPTLETGRTLEPS